MSVPARSRAATFEAAATVLIGVVALLAAMLGMLQADFGMDSARAAGQGSRLAADAGAQIEASSLSRDAALRAKQEALAVGMSGVGLSLAALQAGDATGVALGDAQTEASKALTTAFDETAATSGGAPLDRYTARLIGSTNEAIAAEVRAQNVAVDQAADMGGRSSRAVLGLSLATLGGVLAGVAVVLRAGRAGWITLGVAWAITGAALVAGVLAVL